MLDTGGFYDVTLLSEIIHAFAVCYYTLIIQKLHLRKVLLLFPQNPRC